MTQQQKIYKLPDISTCGKTLFSSIKIVGGSEAAVNSYPWIAALGFRVRNYYRKFCVWCLLRCTFFEVSRSNKHLTFTFKYFMHIQWRLLAFLCYFYAQSIL